MKILQVNNVFKKGSTGKIVHDLQKCLQKDGHETIVCYGRGNVIKGKNVYKFCTELEAKIFALLSRLGWMQYASAPFATSKLIRIIKKEKPDIVHLHCINGFCVNIYRLLRYLQRTNIKTIVTHHAEFLYTGSCGHAYDCIKFMQHTGCHDCTIVKEATNSRTFDMTHKAWFRMKYAFSKFDQKYLIFTAVSPWVVSRSALSPICNKFRCQWVTNGVETDIFKLSSTENIALIKNCIPNLESKLILHVAASFTTEEGSFKGGHFIKQLAELLPDYQFVIVASYVLVADVLPNNVLVWGHTNNQEELAGLYSAADVTVITSKRETFSMITAESLCCGTPVVGFKAGGPESIAISDFTNFVEYGNMEDLKEAVIDFAQREWNSEDISAKAHEAYSKETMTQNYLDVYKKIMNNERI